MSGPNLGQTGRSWKKKKKKKKKTQKMDRKKSSVSPLIFVLRQIPIQREPSTIVSQKVWFHAWCCWHLQSDNLLQWESVLRHVSGLFSLDASDIPSRPPPELWHQKYFQTSSNVPHPLSFFHVCVWWWGGRAERSCSHLRSTWMKWFPIFFSVVISGSNGLVRPWRPNSKY